MNILAQYTALDTELDRLPRLDPVWEKCFPCRNRGLCCVNAHPLALPEELEHMACWLDARPAVLEQVLENMRRDAHCIFYRAEASACLVHDVRPFICRLTPFKGYVQQGDVTVFDASPNPHCQAFLKRSLEIERQEGRYVWAEGRVYYKINDLPGIDGQDARCLMQAHKYFAGRYDL